LGARLLNLRRSVMASDGSGSRWVVTVAGDLGETRAAVHRFDGVLAISLAVLLVLLCLVVVAQVLVGLSPLRRLRRDLVEVLEGRSARLQGSFPVEVQPLVDNFNGVLDRHTAVVSRARTQAGNLAHAIKTPLSVMAQAASSSAGSTSEGLSQVVSEQVEMARRQVDWHLKRARASAAAMPSMRTPVLPVVEGLVRVMQRVHDARGLQLRTDSEDAALAFAGEVQDLQEVLGNVLDNACKWAKHTVRIQVRSLVCGHERRVLVLVDDDGPGIDPVQREAVLARGARLDERMPGSGLGLAIVHELISLYGGALALDASPLGGLRVCCELPRAG
jgi:signal transduction histidine kinase